MKKIIFLSFIAIAGFALQSNAQLSVGGTLVDERVRGNYSRLDNEHAGHIYMCDEDNVSNCKTSVFANGGTTVIIFRNLADSQIDSGESSSYTIPTPPGYEHLSPEARIETVKNIILNGY